MHPYINTEAPMSLSKNASGKKELNTKRLSHAKQALAEAKIRRENIDKITDQTKDEKNGRGGLDPARYGDWEAKGITSDF